MVRMELPQKICNPSPNAPRNANNHQVPCFALGSLVASCTECSERAFVALDINQATPQIKICKPARQYSIYWFIDTLAHYVEQLMELDP